MISGSRFVSLAIGSLGGNLSSCQSTGGPDTEGSDTGADWPLLSCDSWTTRVGRGLLCFECTHDLLAFDFVGGHFLAFDFWAFSSSMIVTFAPPRYLDWSDNKDIKIWEQPEGLLQGKWRPSSNWSEPEPEPASLFGSSSTGEPGRFERQALGVVGAWQQQYVGRLDGHISVSACELMSI